MSDNQEQDGNLWPECNGSGLIGVQLGYSNEPDNIGEDECSTCGGLGLVGVTVSGYQPSSATQIAALHDIVTAAIRRMRRPE